MNSDCLQLIAEFVPPDAATFCVLARVSKLFYQVFTSDHIWRYLDAYDWKINIYSHYLTFCRLRAFHNRYVPSESQETSRVPSHIAENIQFQRGLVRFDKGGLEKNLDIVDLIEWLSKMREYGRNVWMGSDKLDTQITSRKLLWCAVNINPHLIRLASPELKADRKLAKLAVSKCGYVIQCLPFSDDKDMMLASLHSKCPHHCNFVPLDYGSERLTDDEDIALSVVKNYSMGLRAVSLRLRATRHISLSAVRHYGGALRYANNTLRDDVEIVSKAVSRYGSALQFASLRLRSDHDIVASAVDSDGGAIHFAAKSLRSNRQLWLSALTNDGELLKQLPQEFHGDYDLVYAAVSSKGHSLEYVPLPLKDDRKLVQAAISNDASSIKYASENIRDVDDLVFMAVRQSHTALKYASSRLRSNEELARIAMDQSPWAFCDVGESIQDTETFLLDAIRRCGSETVMVPSLGQVRSVLHFASLRLRGDHEIVACAISENPVALLDASNALRDNKEFVLATLTTNPAAMEYASSRLRNDPDIVKLAEAKLVKLNHGGTTNKMAEPRESIDFANTSASLRVSTKRSVWVPIFIMCIPLLLAKNSIPQVPFFVLPMTILLLLYTGVIFLVFFRS